MLGRTEAAAASDVPNPEPSMSVLALAFLSSALAAPKPDLTTRIYPPSASTVDVAATWKFRVSNVGNKSASGVTLIIDLPATNTSPTVYPMGVVGTLPTGCTRSGTRVTCSIGSVSAGSYKEKSFTLALPESSGTLDFATDASTTTSGDNTANNTDTEVGTPANVTVAAPTVQTTVSNDHCTGTGLESYYECELFPSSISSHDVEFHPDGSITIPMAGPDYGGSWVVSGTQLWFEYTELGTPVVDFVGYGVANTTENCWEGIATFPASSYVSPYRVCL